MGSLSLLQGIFPTQGSNPGFPHCRQILYQLSCQWVLVITRLSYSQDGLGQGTPGNNNGCEKFSETLPGHEEIRVQMTLSLTYVKAESGKKTESYSNRFHEMYFKFHQWNWWNFGFENSKKVQVKWKITKEELIRWCWAEAGYIAKSIVKCHGNVRLITAKLS